MKARTYTGIALYSEPPSLPAEIWEDRGVIVSAKSPLEAAYAVSETHLVRPWPKEMIVYVLLGTRNANGEGQLVYRYLVTATDCEARHEEEA